MAFWVCPLRICTYVNFCLRGTIKIHVLIDWLLNYWDWNQSACQLGGVDYDCLDMLNVKMMQTGSSNVWRWWLREPGRGNIRGRLGKIMSKGMRRVLACPTRMLRRLKIKAELGKWLLKWHVCMCVCIKYVTTCNLFRWYIAVWQAVFFTDYRQMTNHFNGPRITGQDYNAITIITAQHWYQRTMAFTEHAD